MAIKDRIDHVVIMINCTTLIIVIYYDEHNTLKLGIGWIDKILTY